MEDAAIVALYWARDEHPLFRKLNNKGRTASLFALFTGSSMLSMFFFNAKESQMCIRDSSRNTHRWNLLSAGFYMTGMNIPSRLPMLYSVRRIFIMSVLRRVTAVSYTHLRISLPMSYFCGICCSSFSKCFLRTRCAGVNGMMSVFLASSSTEETVSRYFCTVAVSYTHLIVSTFSDTP